MSEQTERRESISLNQTSPTTFTATHDLGGDIITIETWEQRNEHPSHHGDPTHELRPQPARRAPPHPLVSHRARRRDQAPIALP